MSLGVAPNCHAISLPKWRPLRAQRKQHDHLRLHFYWFVCLHFLLPSLERRSSPGFSVDKNVNIKCTKKMFHCDKKRILHLKLSNDFKKPKYWKKIFRTNYNYRVKNTHERGTLFVLQEPLLESKERGKWRIITWCIHWHRSLAPLEVLTNSHKLKAVQCKRRRRWAAAHKTG